MSADNETPYDGSEIAIIGMACRFPGASTPEAFWRNLVAGAESLTTLSEEELLAAGVPAEAVRDPRYVRRAGFAEGIELFDPAFFGYTPLEAKIMDPQHRLFLECAWEAFEHAGYNPEGNRDRVGVFTGAKTNTYLFSLFSNRELFRTLDSFQLALGNDLAAMATRISYKLNLKGPSYGLHTACSTSLVAVHLACQSLLLGECRMALAGGSAVNVPFRTGYLYQKGGILSPDGSCRTFDEKAQGSNFSNGSGAVLLKRLEDALADGDHVHAIIRGSASNNDGSAKASFTAPGVEGQTDLLIDALACAGVDADTISYIEAHGTGTDLGDTIEMLALTEAFRASTPRRGFCAIGSVKTNLGHLEVAAGVAGLIKTALALEHRQIPPSLHYQKPNPRIDFESSPFYVATQLTDWQADGPRRAGVSSFGIGSTNAHVILEEPPPATAGVPVTPSRPWQLLLLSARSESALNTMTANLGRRLESLSDGELPDAAYTLQTGRKDFAWRRAVICRGTDGLDGAVAALSGADPERVLTHLREPADLPVAFLFPGLGDHHAEMGLGLYRTERVFREELDRCAELLQPHLGVDLREALYPRGTDAEEEAAGKLDLRRMLGRGERGDKDTAPRRIDETWLAHPALFAVEYALARLWMSWGIVPQSLVGYSLGEYVAACLAGVLELPCALALVARRARLIQDLEPGAMLAVSLPEAELVPHLESYGLSLAAVNGPSICVAAGPVPAVEALERDLGELGVTCRRLPTHHAFHSSMMESLSGPLTELVRTFELKAPAIPYISNVTGTWITPEQATDPGYWARHTIAAVRFADGVRELLAGHDRILLEVGPGQGLSSFVKQLPECDAEAARLVFPSMRSGYARQGDLEVLLGAAARIWLTGRKLDWQAFWQDERRRRVPLPAYPFERQRYWVDPVLDDRPPARRVTLDKQTDMADWFYRPVWRPDPAAERPEPLPELPRTGWLLLADREGLGEALAARLRSDGHDVTLAFAGAGFAEADPDSWTVDPARPQDYDALLAAVTRRSVPLTRVVHLWSAPPLAADDPYEAIQDAGFYSLIHLAQALGRRSGAPVHIDVVSSQVQSVKEDDPLVPEKATLLGPCRVIPQEIARLTCRSIDLAWPEADPGALVDHLLTELALAGDEPVVAWRGGERFVQGFQRERMEEVPDRPARLQCLRQGGVYLLTGGLGGLGLAVAEHLARTVRAKLVLTGRSPFPPREEWDGWLHAHGEEGDATSRRIRQLLDLEELGAEVLALSADVADAARMSEVIAAARERFGALHGVIHLAGTPGGGILQLKTREAAARIVSPKVEGARVLDGILAGQPLDFFVCFSSIASILGEFGQADYCGANAFLDAFAQRNARRGGPPFLTIDWDIWSEVGLAVHTEVPAHLRPWRQEMLQQAIRPAEGTMAFRRLLERALGRIPQVVVSAQDLHGRIELGKSFTGESFLAELEKLDHGHSYPSGEAKPARRVLGTGFVAAAADGSLERRVAEVWQRVLGVEQVGLHDNFFDLGGNSLLGLQLVSELGRDLGVQVAPVTLFESPTVSALTRQIQPEPEAETMAAVALAAANAVKDELAERRRRLRDGGGRVPVAIIGMAGRFPGAGNVEELWQNLRDGVESVSFFSDDELRAAGVPEEVLADPRYVRAGSVLEGVDLFDAGLFGYSPREAEVMDPQHRIFLETAWETLERAGYDPGTYAGSIGVFAGSNLSTYLLQLYGDPDVKASVNMLQAILGNDKDSLTTTVSYKLNLRGPSVAVQTFCSTSLVAVHMACRSLRTGECDMALAGGIRVVVPDHQGYLYEQGGIAPSDGHSRSFDAKANGSILGHGVGIVCLKRLDDALADGDPIHAVILGSAINNDGSLKAGYTAPSVAGQADAVMAAYEDAGVSPEDLSYVEAHGSATELGDPIEVTALTKAFRTWTDRRQYCPIGSVKANFGHLDRAAGVTGLIKTVMAMEHEEIPPNILFEEPNPKIDFAGSPFFVNTERRPWPSNPTAPRRAGVNSLGMGGTNVHVIVEEAPRREPSGPSRPWQLLLLSARTPTALDRATANLAGHLEAHPDVSLADAAFTLQVGRKALEHRRAVVVRDAAGNGDARAVLEGDEPRRVLSAWSEDRERGVVFLFSGMGGQYPDMGRGLYDSEPTFKKDVDRCAEILQPLLGVDLREVMYPASSSSSPEASTGVDLRKMLRRAEPSADGADDAAARLHRTRFAQPALFVLEYALARLWMEWGIRPQAMMGYSLGEYVAACLAGVFTLEDALSLVAERARLIEELPEGAMLAVSLSEAEAAALLGDELSLAAVNGPEQSVLAGPLAAVEALERDLAGRGIACRRLQTTHAFHSKMMEPIRQTWAERVGRATLRPPQIPYISNVTGTWIAADEATDPAFWAGHTCQPVRFSEGVAELRRDPDRVLLEIGPGATLASLVLQHPASKAKEGEREGEALVVAALRHSYETQPDVAYALTALAKLWLAGVRVDWSGFYVHERRHRLVLPTYPFERQRYWIDTVDATRGERRAVSRAAAGERAHLYLPSWRRAPLAGAGIPEPGRWLVFADGAGIGETLAERLRGMGSDVALVHAGREEEPFTDLGGGDYRYDPRSAEAHAALLEVLGRAPDRVVHLTSVSSSSPTLGFQSLAALAGALVGRGLADPIHLWVIADELHEVSGEEEPSPERAALLGAVKAIPRELPQVACQAVDIAVPETHPGRERLLRQLLAELAAASPDRLVALRGNHRWTPATEPLEKTAAAPIHSGLWLLSAGLGEAGFAFTRELAGAKAKLLLLEPAGFPAREEWDEWLEGDSQGVVGHLLRNARTLEEQGTELEVVGVDLADGARLHEVVAAAEARWGAVRGAVWVAEPGTSEGHLAGALTGLRSLDALLAARALTSALLVVPEGAPGAEAAALGFLADAFATGSALAGGTPWTSVAWALPAEEEGASAAARRLLGGVGALQVLASPRPLPERWSRLEAFPESESTARTGVGYYPRPSLRVEYVAPRNETEEYIARIWKDLLGVAQVGIHDNFLDLGGDSLLATRLVARMRDTFHLDLPVRLFFEKSTVAELAEAVVALRHQEQEREAEELLAKIHSLSEDELEQELLRMEGLVGEEEPARG